MDKRIGFLSFGHLQPVAGAAGGAGRGRVHHSARQLASPFPLLAAIAARTSRIEIGTGVIDMRYENALYMAEEAAAADLIADGRLQLGTSRGSPEPALRGSETFGYLPGEAQTDADLARD